MQKNVNHRHYSTTFLPSQRVLREVFLEKRGSFFGISPYLVSKELFYHKNTETPGQALLCPGEFLSRSAQRFDAIMVNSVKEEYRHSCTCHFRNGERPPHSMYISA